MANCCICYSTFKSNDLLTSTECGHVFHQACIYTWLATNRNSPTCPNCRHRVAQDLLRRLHLNLDEEITQNDSKVHELQKNLISMEDKLKKAQQKKTSLEKKCNTLSKSNSVYQQRAVKLREENNDLKEDKKDLKIQLREERKKRKFYEDEYIALSGQVEAMQNGW